MDPFITGGLIKAGGSLLGGLLGKKSKAPTPSEQIIGHMEGIRKGAEMYGFNPLAWAGTTGGGGGGEVDPMGSAIADAFGAVADGFTMSQVDKAEKQALAEENEALRRKVQVETIRPKMGGLFDRPQGETITLTAGADGWVNEFSDEADFIGKQVKLRPDGTYQQKNPARTTLMTPLGETTPANVSDAEDYEMRYGDPVSWAVGLGVLASDAGQTLRSFTDGWGLTTQGENLVTDTLPRNMREWRDQTAAEKAERRKFPGYSRKSGAYEGWMKDFYGEGVFIQ